MNTDMIKPEPPQSVGAGTMENVVLSKIPRYDKEREMIQLVDKYGRTVVELNHEMIEAISKLLDGEGKR